jgi:hypothetical protein
MIKPVFYPHGPNSVEFIQTHISYIFIAGALVYKVKKAVDFGFLDFTSLDKRRFYCNEEVRLNRRLAQETYLEVAEICEDESGNLMMGKRGKVIEYAVVMKKLPADRMLKLLLIEGRVDASIMDAVARKLANFHDRAETGGKIDEIGGVDTICRNHEENFVQTEKYIGSTIPKFQYQFIKRYIHRFMDREAELLKRRVRDHRIRDCHGDLHLEHICITDEIIIFDCIEFNERFRYGDVSAEVSFLAMDLDFNGYPEHGNEFVNAYVEHSGDREIRVLLNFYKTYYAYVRGKVTSFRSDDEAIVDKERKEAKVTASRYFELAYRYASQLERPALIIMTGLMGTGKSVLARNIAPALGADIVRTDVLRKEMLNLSPVDRHHEPFGEGIYSERISEETYARALEYAREKLRLGRSVIIDASYRKRSERLKAGETASRVGADFFVLECMTPEHVIRKRLENRLNDREEPSDGRWDIFAEQKTRFEPVEECSGKNHIVIDTSGCCEASASEALYKIRFGDEV